VLSLVARASAEARGLPFDEDGDAERRAQTEAQITAEQTALAVTSRGYDDGIIDPRDTRTVLGIALSACHSNSIRGAESFGVFRM
jgi:acetyl-CoA carboxylase carboxyltransferase component